MMSGTRWRTRAKSSRRLRATFFRCGNSRSRIRHAGPVKIPTASLTKPLLSRFASSQIAISTTRQPLEHGERKHIQGNPALVRTHQVRHTQVFEMVRLEAVQGIFSSKQNQPEEWICRGTGERAADRIAQFHGAVDTVLFPAEMMSPPCAGERWQRCEVPLADNISPTLSLLQ